MSNSTEINQQYFNKVAAEYDQRFARSLVQVKAELKENADFIGIKKGGRLLDYACGTGLLSQSLSDSIGQAVGVDISENMVGAYNAKAENENIPEEKQKAYLGNLLSTPTSPSLDDPIFHDFDVAGVGAGFHHFEDTTLAATRLAERLRPEGSLFILDFIPHAAEPHHDASHGVHHLGFSQDNIRKLFEDAGAAGDFAYKELNSEVIFENVPAAAAGQGKMDRKFFLARGTKTACSGGGSSQL